MNDDIKKCTDEALRNAVEALAVTITCTAKEFIACISKVTASLAKMSWAATLSEDADKASQRAIKKWQKTLKCRIRSQRNSAYRKHRKHGRQQRTRMRR